MTSGLNEVALLRQVDHLFKSFTEELYELLLNHTAGSFLQSLVKSFNFRHEL
jgi:hypothetical protein